MAKYKYKGRIITLSDELVKRYGEVWFGQGPRDSLFTRYLAEEYHTPFLSDIIRTKSDEELSDVIAKWMECEIEANV